jgi:hypothetical protein
MKFELEADSLDGCHLMLKQETSEDNFLKHLGDVFDLLRLFHILVTVYIGIYLQTQEGETKVVGLFLGEGRCFPINCLEKIREKFDLFQTLCDIIIDIHRVAFAPEDILIQHVTPRSL